MMWNMFKVNNKNTKTTCFSSVSIFDFEQVNVSCVIKLTISHFTIKLLIVTFFGNIYGKWESFFILFTTSIEITAWNVSKYRYKCVQIVFLVRVFPHLDWIRRDQIQPNAGKYEPEKTPYLDTFQAMNFLMKYLNECHEKLLRIFKLFSIFWIKGVYTIWKCSVSFLDLALQQNQKTIYAMNYFQKMLDIWQGFNYGPS